MADPALITLTCRDCGRLIARNGRTGALIHRAGGAVAACDLDVDHQPRPDWRSLGTVTCGVCGTPAGPDEDGTLVHADPARQADHTPDPWGTAARG